MTCAGPLAFKLGGLVRLRPEPATPVASHDADEDLSLSFKRVS